MFFLLHCIVSAILKLSGRVLPDDFPQVTHSERELVIDFITSYLQPVIVEGELQGFNVDLVEQYIRPGEVRKPLELVVAHSLKDNADRAKLRDLVNLSEEKLRTSACPGKQTRGHLYPRLKAYLQRMVILPLRQTLINLCHVT
ncbi:hypothetical protein AHF37_11187 [Paragonimus kellicotti]|nr:hypothetical protein AHF37_11187 [Paragonimus kellicotti]